MFDTSVRTISVERALRWLQGFAGREWSLLLPVALAFFALPGLVLAYLTPAITKLPQTPEEAQAMFAAFPVWWIPLFLATSLTGVIGAMTLIALAVVPRLTVGEAIVLALRKTPIWIVTGLIVTIVFFLGVILLTMLVLASGGGQLLTGFLTILYMAPASLLMVLILPLLVDRRIGPWAVVRASWRLYNGTLLRIAGALILFLVTTYIVSLALRVSLGSLLLLVGRVSGQPQLGELLAMILVSAIGAIAWSGFYLLIAAFYRQRIGID